MLGTFVITVDDLRPLLVESVEDVHAMKAASLSRYQNSRGDTYYARPPQKPSMLIRRKTNEMLSPSESSLNIPTADSIMRMVRIAPCTKAGRLRNRAGRGGRPKEIDDRERKTVVW